MHLLPPPERVEGRAEERARSEHGASEEQGSGGTERTWRARELAHERRRESSWHPENQMAICRHASLAWPSIAQYCTGLYRIVQDCKVLYYQQANPGTPLLYSFKLNYQAPSRRAVPPPYRPAAREYLIFLVSIGDPC